MQYEVEIKCLIGGEAQSQQLLEDITHRGYAPQLTAEYEQLNDYFVGDNMPRLAESLRSHLSASDFAELEQIITDNNVFSVRARQNNEEIFFIVKASAEGSATHNTQRVEFERHVELPLEQLKDGILASGFSLQARWFAHRKLYKLSNGITFDNIFSPGYGYQAEFELLVTKDEASTAEAQVRTFVEELGLTEAPKETLTKMFDYYNAHWQDYYGSNNVFTPEEIGA